MATLQKFKLFATHCGVAPSPTRSPRTSPLVQLPRRKNTLRMLFSRSASLRLPRRLDSPLQLKHLLDSPEEEEEKKEKEKENAAQRNSLKELFVSSPPKEEQGRGEISDIHIATEFGSAATETLSIAALGGPVSWRDGSGSIKPGWTGGFRCRSLLRKAWRPILLTIPE